MAGAATSRTAGGPLIACNIGPAGCAAPAIFQEEQFMMPATLGVPMSQSAHVVIVEGDRKIYSPMFIGLYDKTGRRHGAPRC